jgi:hypothetical protein
MRLPKQSGAIIRHVSAMPILAGIVPAKLQSRSASCFSIDPTTGNTLRDTCTAVPFGDTCPPFALNCKQCPPGTGPYTGCIGGKAFCTCIQIPN